MGWRFAAVYSLPAASTAQNVQRPFAHFRPRRAAPQMTKAVLSPAAAIDRDLEVVDPEVARWIREEERRQNDSLELIASENCVSRAVREAQGSVLTNKYAEGYPGKRYYGGCEFVDRIERSRSSGRRRSFGAEHANVQPHSGSQANMAVYLTALKPGDTILGMDLSHGGHLTHGHPALLLGQGVQGRRLRRPAGGRAHRLRRAGARWRASTARA